MERRMITIIQHPDGRLTIPCRAADPETGLAGDGVTTIGPDHPDYDRWRAYMAHHPDAVRRAVPDATA
jgi:hypothetical protein